MRDMVEKIVRRTVKEHRLFGNTMHIIIGLSGGPDSLCLFDLLCRMAKPMALHLYPVHVNHGLRTGAAEEEQRWVEAVCAARGWPCRTFAYDCKQIAAEEGLTSEEAGRSVRYRSFAAVATELIARGIARTQIVIAVGHNRNDQCETILFRLLRGTGIDGLSGIAYKRYDAAGTAIVRPLLDVRRAEIEAYCLARNLQPRRDLTNDEPIYTRNRIRLELLPYLREEYNAGIDEALWRLGRLAASDSDYMQEQAEAAFSAAFVAQDDGGVTLATAQLKTLHPAVRSRVYRKALRTAGIAENVSLAHLAGIETIVLGENPSGSCDVPGGRVVRQYAVVRFVAKRRTAVESDGPKRPKREETSDSGAAAINARFSLAALQAVYGPDAAKQVTLRHRRDGDFMQIRIDRAAQALHRKKLQDIMVDMKVPRETRDHLWLAAIGREILWILPPVSPSGDFTVSVLPAASREGFSISACTVNSDFDDAVSTVADRPRQAGRLPEKGRFSAAYRLCRDGEETAIALEYLFQM